MAKAISKQRIVTVKATGRRHVVCRMEFPKDNSPGKVFCYGEIADARETSNGGVRWRWEGGMRKFLIDAVEISEVEFTWEYCFGMWQESMEIKAANLGDGAVFKKTGKGRTTRAVKAELTTDELLAEAARAEDLGKHELSNKLFTAAEKADL